MVDFKNCLAYLAPELAKEWHPTKNATLSPTDVSIYSNKKVWWQCRYGHEWEAIIANRSKGRKCPICTNRIVLKGYNDLATKMPVLAREWHPYRNGILTASDVTSCSNKKVWWLCQVGHEWEATIAKRSSGQGCPVCAGHTILQGYNDLATTNPVLATEWHPTKNHSLTPHDITSGSGHSVWWQCKRGHEWKARVDHRSKGIGCPYCAKKACWPGENDLASCYPELLTEWDYDRNELSPDHIAAHSSKSVFWKCSKGHAWKATVQNRTAGNGCPYCANRKVLAGYNDLQTILPDLVLEWDWEKNWPLLPSQVTCRSNRRVSWKCSLGHEWQATISNRANGVKCPVCMNKTVLKGFNDLATTHPELANEWNYSKNGEHKPEDYVAGSSARVWWYCSHCGHEWQTQIVSRKNGTSCPKCYDRNRTSFPEQTLFYYVGKRFVKAQNRCVNILDEKLELDIYIPEKNVAIEYDGAYWHSGNGEKERYKYQQCVIRGIYLIRVKEQKAEWDEFSADQIIYVNESIDEVLDQLERVLNVKLNHCVDRDKKRILAAYYDAINAKSLAIMRPMIASEWNYDKNQGLTPDMFYEYSNERVWWKCGAGHEWEAIISNRCNLGRGCPYCAHQKAISGVNDVFSIHPYLLDEWDESRNGIAPSNILPGSNKHYWWKCTSCGYSWRTTIAKRSSGQNCPKCGIVQRSRARIKSESGFISEAHLASPHITVLGNYVNANTKLLVKCDACSYSWEVSPSRLIRGIKCPACINRIVIPGRNDLESQYPLIALDWNQEKNFPLKPRDVVYGSSKKVHWKCHICQFEWVDSIEHRSSGRQCPQCIRKNRHHQR